jgi:hypothetical protein
MVWSYRAFEDGEPLGSSGRRLHGQAATSRGKEWRYYRCRGCPASAVVADVVEHELCERISLHALALPTDPNDLGGSMVSVQPRPG